MDDPVDLVFAEYLDLALRGGTPDLERLIAAHPELDDAQRRRLRELAGVVEGSEIVALPFDRIGDFRLIRRLGEGGMGIVYLAEQVSLRRAVALKLVRPERVGSPTVAARFEREALAVARLRHPSVVTVLAAGEERGVRYLAMELVPGKGLHERLAEERAAGRPVAIPAVVAWGRDLARGLAAAHESGVVHRDVKPSNVRITPEGRAMLVDFGLARVESEDSLSATGAFHGSPAYASPEQISGSADGIDARTDVYSLGATLYECIAGRVPFAGETTEQVFRGILMQEPESLRRLRPEASRDTEAVIATAMEKDPARRYATAAAFADDLDALLELRPIAARPLSPLGRAWRWTRRNRAKSSALAMAAILVLVAPSVIAWRESVARIKLADEQQKTEAQRAEVQRRLEEVRRLSDTQLVRDAFEQAPRLGPPLPDRLDRFDRFLRGAGSLRARLPQHEETLARWKSIAPDTPDAPSPWELSVLQDMVRQIRKLDPVIERAKGRREFAATSQERTVSGPDASAAWARAIRSIEEDPRYGGLRLTPQIGLLPLERDPESGLWEFLHAQSGARPRRDEKTGRWALEPATGIVLVLVPGGSFRMGAVPPTKDRPAGGPNVDPDAAPIDGPVVELTLDPFFLSKYEMTIAQWERASGSIPNLYGPGNPDVTLIHPVEGVSWDDCAPLLDGLDLRFPSEAQWECACRAGTTTVYSTGNAPGSLQGFANLADSFFRKTTGLTNLAYTAEIDDGFKLHAPVGSYRPNPWGFHDMHGNVREWCGDSDKIRADESHVASRRSGDGLFFLERAATRIIRGGGFLSTASLCRSAWRGFTRSSTPNDSLGVRPARAVR